MDDKTDEQPPHVQATHTIEGFTFEGGTVVDLRIGCWTMGELNADGSNVMLLSHGASGNRDWALPHCRSGRSFEPAGRFIISVDLPGGGDSSRLSTTPGFPMRYTLHDLTNALAALLDRLGARRNVLFSGVSVSTLVGLDLAATRPDLFGGMSLWNCAARGDGYASSVIDAVAAILTLDNGPAGMKAAVKSFYPSLTGRDRLAATEVTERARIEERIAEGWIAHWRADEIIARYLGTIGGDVPAIHGGEQALAAKIACPILWLPCSSDQLLPASSMAAFARRVPTGQLAICQSDRGHQSTSATEGSPEFRFYDGKTAEFFRSIADENA